MNTHTKAPVLLGLLLGLTLMPVTSSHAETTPLVNYQGKLTKNGKNENGQINITFKIFTSETNGVCVYEESQQVAVADGYYSTLIGKHPTFGSIEEACMLDDAYLELIINSQTLSPREKFTPPPFAKATEQRWNMAILARRSDASPLLSSPSLAYWNPPNFIWDLGVNTDDAYNFSSNYWCFLFSAPIKPVRLVSAGVLINAGSNLWTHPELQPEMRLRTTARTVENSARILGPDLRVFTTNIVPGINQLRLPLSTNTSDLHLATSELLCIEMRLVYPAQEYSPVFVATNPPDYLQIDVRVR